MNDELEMALHREAVGLWRVSLERELTSGERELFVAAQARLNPLLPVDALLRPLGRKPNPFSMR